MYPDDRVLVGVLKSKDDLVFAQHDHWYRIPRERMPRGVFAEYVALFSGSKVVNKGEKPGVYHYAPVQGQELVYRRDLIPDSKPEQAGQVYYKMALGELKQRPRPILNPARRRFAFIYTTWDRFLKAETLRDLYSDGDYYVDRIYHALRERGYERIVERTWEAESRETGRPPGVHILCANGNVVASTEAGSGNLYLDGSQSEDEILTSIRKAIASHGGPVSIDIPLE